jgi:hypothetical protein
MKIYCWTDPTAVSVKRSKERKDVRWSNPFIKGTVPLRCLGFISINKNIYDGGGTVNKSPCFHMSCLTLLFCCARS